jgi:hypothetical protein
VEFPTRLGNTIHSYETYSKTRYGLEAIFYWPRIWVNLDKDLREEIDSQQAVADSCVYSAFALGAAGMLWLLYGLAVIFEFSVSAGLKALDRMPNLGEGIFRHLPSPGACLTASLVFLLLSALAYRLAISTNEQFGVVFMAVIDTHARQLREKYIDVNGITKKVGTLTGIDIDESNELDVVRRYLQYYNVKLPGQRRAVAVPKARPAAAPTTTPQ